jgi:hypothetical protein
MKRTAMAIVWIALIGMVVYGASHYGKAVAQSGGGDRCSATALCEKACDHRGKECPGDPSQCQGQCNCKDCKEFKDANGDGRCDVAGKCAKHGSDKKAGCPKAACPGHSSS